MRIGGASVALPCEVCRAQAELEEEQREREKRVEEMLDRAGGTPRMRAWSWGTYPTDSLGRRVLALAEDWLAGYRAGDRRNLFLYGPQGVGKTGLAWSLVVRVIRELEREALFVNFRILLEELRLSYSDRRAGVPTDYVRVDRVPVLALDDIGSERPTDFAREELANLVEARYGKRLPTIVTSNYAPNELAVRLGHDDPVIGLRIVSRLREDALGMEIQGKDRRRG